MAQNTVSDLYELDPKDFVAGRDQLTRELRADGDKDGAKAVKGLRRPSIPVWALNQVARQQPDVVEALLQASDDAHGATGPRVKDALAARRDHLHRVVRAARDVIEASGRSADQYELEITSSLSTVLGREALAADLRAGVLNEVTDDAGMDWPEGADVSTASDVSTALDAAPARKPEPESKPEVEPEATTAPRSSRRPRPPAREAESVPTVLVSQPAPGVTQLTLNRPDSLNAMNAELIEALHDALDAIAADRSCRAVVLTGSGRGFCAGLDLKGYGTPPGAEGRKPVQAGFATQTHIAALIPHLRSLPVPVIAAVNGAAAGGGFALTLGSDIRIAGASARFNVAFVRIGLSGCDIGVSWLLPRLIGASRAWELMLTGRIIDATEADHIGLVSRVVSDDSLLDAALETASLIVANSPWGVRMTKEVAWSQLEIASLQAGIDIENRTQILSSFTGDVQEATKAFFERRPTVWED